jgi:hypothetical protein
MLVFTSPNVTLMSPTSVLIVVMPPCPPVIVPFRSPSVVLMIAVFPSIVRAVVAFCLQKVHMI